MGVVWKVGAEEKGGIERNIINTSGVTVNSWNENDRNVNSMGELEEKAENICREQSRKISVQRQGRGQTSQILKQYSKKR